MQSLKSQCTDKNKISVEKHFNKKCVHFNWKEKVLDKNYPENIIHLNNSAHFFEKKKAPHIRFMEENWQKQTKSYHHFSIMWFKCNGSL